MLKEMDRPSLLALLVALSLAPACQRLPIPSDDESQPKPEPDLPDWGDEIDEVSDWDDLGDQGDQGDQDEDTGLATTKFDTEPPSTIECGQVDLLFVIDDSHSMLAEQTALIASFDAFIAGIQSQLDEDNDYHVGIVTTDAYVANAPGCRDIGALVTQTEEDSCGPWSQGRFISLDDPLAEAFTCAAEVGLDGDSDERQIQAALEALGPTHAGVGGCNEGFFRDDALLVLVLISDEDDGGSPIPGFTGSPGDPSQWFEQFAELEGGVESNIVVLGLIGVPPPNACDPDDPFELNIVATRLSNFIDKFTFGFEGDVCADDYGPFFEDALSIIEEACLGFTPIE